MKKVFRYFTMMLAIGGATLTSCLDKEEIVNNQKEQYQDNWVKVFGNIDPDHDWSVAKQVNATFNLAGVVSGEHTARIYTEHPYNKKCKLLAEFKVNGSGTVSFDTEKTTKHVYIRVENAEGQMAFDGYFTIEGNELVADSRTIAGRSLSRATPNDDYFDAHTIGSVQRDGQTELNEITQQANTTVDLGTIYYPKTPIQSSGEVTIGFNDYLIPIVNNSNTAIFQEFKDNRTKTSTQGVEYVTITNGEVQLDYVFGMTGLYNTIGYFYWNPDNGGTYTDAPKIVLLEDAEPDHILKGKFYENGVERIEDFSETAQTDNQYGMVLNQYVRGNKTPPTQLIGQSYKLLYYGEDYQSAGTTTFPAGTHIGFFLYTNYWDTSRTSNNQGSPYSTNGDYAYGRQNPKDVETNSTYRTNLVYSIPAYNQAIKESYNYRINESDYQQQNGNNNYNVNIDKGEISAVTYNYQGKTILGFEDGVDKDMNDILFVVNANVEVAGGEVVNLGGSNNTPTQSWIIACEDLGSVGDYDFNDAVFSVSHVGGSDQLTVTPLAAGGTYPIKLLYNDQPVGNGNDFHQLIDGNANKQGDLWKPINADTKGTAGNSIIISNVPQNYSINQHGFSVEVEKNEGTSITIKQSMVNDKEQKAPQMLILPGNWIWPKESMPIHSGYPRFAQWNADQQQNTDWYTNNNEHNDIAEDKLVGSYGNQGGSGGTGGDIPEVEEPVVTNYDISITVDGQDKDPIQTQNDNNYYLELPKEYFATSGTTTITLNGANQTGNNLEIRLGGAQLVWTNTNTMQLDASKVTGNVRLYIWDGSATQFSQISGIVITNNGGGNVEPETPTLYWDYWTSEGNNIYSIPTTKLKEILGTNSSIKITIDPKNGQDKAGLYYKKDDPANSILVSLNGTSSDPIVIEIPASTLNSWSNDKIYTSLENNGEISDIKIEAVESSTTPEEPSEDGITFTVDDVAQDALTLNTNDYSIAIPKSALTGTNGAKIEITSTQNIGGSFNGGNNVQIHDISSKIINLTGEQITQLSNEIKIYVHTNATSITAITITNDNTGGGTSTPTTVTIPIKVNGTEKNALTATNNKFTIPLSEYGISSNGATITFAGEATITINDTDYTTTYNVESSNYNKDIEVTIKSGTITQITITNKESGSNKTALTKDNINAKSISIAKTDLPIYTNGLTVKITKDNNGGNIIVSGGVDDWGGNKYSGYSQPNEIKEYSVTKDFIDSISGSNVVIWTDGGNIIKVEILSIQ